MMEDIIGKYFPDISPGQKEQLSRLQPLYADWNARINVISRKDMDNFLIHHVLHSLSIAKIVSFAPGTTILDVGTGGGFPGIPLAILFPGSRFTLLDSILKKIRVVSEISSALGLQNVTPVRERVEDHKPKYDFVLSRALTTFTEFVRITSGRVEKGGANSLRNGIICLKGGDIGSELGCYINSVRIWDIGTLFEEPYFMTKRIVYLPA